MFWNLTAWAMVMHLETEEGICLGRTHAKWLQASLWCWFPGYCSNAIDRIPRLPYMNTDIKLHRNKKFHPIRYDALCSKYLLHMVFVFQLLLR